MSVVYMSIVAMMLCLKMGFGQTAPADSTNEMDPTKAVILEAIIPVAGYAHTGKLARGILVNGFEFTSLYFLMAKGTRKVGSERVGFISIPKKETTAIGYVSGLSFIAIHFWKLFDVAEQANRYNQDAPKKTFEKVSNTSAKLHYSPLLLNNAKGRQHFGICLSYHF
jgi:hypothetical protein